MVSGGAGATVIVLIALMQSSGLECVCSCSFSGVLQMVGLFVVNLSTGPAACNVWVCEWIGIIIFMSQLEQFKTMANGESVWLSEIHYL
jgi:SulP family sulfate permease